jgi:homoserine dehydrogenase
VTAPPPAAALHLLGPGHVGRSFLRQLAPLPVRVVAVSDASATVYAREGLPVAALCAHKAAGRPLATWPGAERIPTDVALRVVAADVVADATPTRESDAAAAVARGLQTLALGGRLVLSAKNALAAAATTLLLGPGRERVGVDGVLGGAGAAIAADLADLRAHCTGLALVGNVTTTVLVEAFERGLSVAAGIADATARGLLEPDPTLDLDGSDAATKLRAVWGMVFGAPGGPMPAAAAVAREDVRNLDVGLLRARAARGATTRLVGRGDRAGNLRVQFEELPVGSPLAVPPDRVAYGFELPGGAMPGLRVHVGFGVGYEQTAAAMVRDVARVLGLAAS